MQKTNFPNSEFKFELRRCARHWGEYGLMNYVPPALVHCHLVAAQAERPAIAWPRAPGETARRQQAGQETLRSWLEGLSTLVAQCSDRRSLLPVSGAISSCPPSTSALLAILLLLLPLSSSLFAYPSPP